MKKLIIPYLAAAAFVALSSCTTTNVEKTPTQSTTSTTEERTISPTPVSSTTQTTRSY